MTLPDSVFVLSDNLKINLNPQQLHPKLKHLKKKLCFVLLHSPNHIQPYTYTCWNKINNNDERTSFFRKIYLSHFIQNGYERVMCERWVGDWTETATYSPPVPLSLAALLSRSAGLLNRGSWRAIALCWVLVLSTASYLQPTELPVVPGYIIVWHQPASCERRICTQFNPSTVKAIS